MSKIEYKLNGLTCASCAGKIENDLSKLEGIKEASINLMNNKLSLDMNNKLSFNIENKIKEIVGKHEPDVRVETLTKGQSNNHNHSQDDHSHGYELDTKAYFVRIIISILLIAVDFLIKMPSFISTIILVIAYIIVGYEILIQAIKNIARGQIFDENFLMGFASLGAFLIGERIEAIAVLVFYGVGEILQDMAVNRSKTNIAKLMDIRPDYANVEIDGEILTVSPDEVNVEDIILVKPGEKIPLDGVVISGRSYVDTKALTGESVPVEVFEGKEVLSGSINESGVIRIKVIKTYGESTVSKILDLVENASGKKAESEKFITKFARYYTPIVVFLALGVAIFPPLLGYGSFNLWIIRALSFLIISCPCALVISIPLSFFGGIGGSARHGILVKGGNYLDAINEIDVLVFDKTGTLTEGVFQVTDIVTEENVSKEELIKLAAIAENKSNHPIAKSIMEYYGKEIEEADEISERAGYGIIAKFKEDTILAGNGKLMEEDKIKYSVSNKVGSIIHIAKNNEYLGHIIVSDKIRDNVPNTISNLHKLGIKETIMLTGDSKSKADEIGKVAGIDKIYSELLPQDKVSIFDKIKSEKKTKGKIAFIGDGINDAPVLAGADVGIAMGGIGSDAAIEAADVVFMHDDFSSILTAIKISKKTRKIVAENIVFALGVKIIIMILAFFGITSIWFAIFADVGVALIALLNATRAMRVRE